MIGLSELLRYCVPAKNASHGEAPGVLQERNQLTLGRGLAGWVVRDLTADSADMDAKEQS